MVVRPEILYAVETTKRVFEKLEMMKRWIQGPTSTCESEYRLRSEGWKINRLEHMRRMNNDRYSEYRTKTWLIMFRKNSDIRKHKWSGPFK